MLFVFIFVDSYRYEHTKQSGNDIEKKNEHYIQPDDIGFGVEFHSDFQNKRFDVQKVSAAHIFLIVVGGIRCVLRDFT